MNGPAGGVQTADPALDAAGALHDLNNALQAIGATLRRVEVRLARNDTQEIPALIAAVHYQLARAAHLARDIHGLTVLTASLHDAFSAEGFVRGMVPQIGVLLNETTRFDLLIDPEAGLLDCDPARLESGIHNLVLNARDAMGQDGVLRIGVRRIHLGSGPNTDGSGGEPGSYVEITVADDGCGMSPALLETCFEPYVSTKKAKGGSGLGLSRLRTFARSAGGDVRLDSCEGQGTVATILLPCLERNPA